MVLSVLGGCGLGVELSDLIRLMASFLRRLHCMYQDLSLSWQPYLHVCITTRNQGLTCNYIIFEYITNCANIRYFENCFMLNATIIAPCVIDMRQWFWCWHNCIQRVYSPLLTHISHNDIYTESIWKYKYLSVEVELPPVNSISIFLPYQVHRDIISLSTSLSTSIKQIYSCQSAGSCGVTIPPPKNIMIEGMRYQKTQ